MKLKLGTILIAVAVLTAVAVSAPSAAQARPAEPQKVTQLGCTVSESVMLSFHPYDGQVHQSSDVVPPTGCQFILFDGRESQGSNSVVRAWMPAGTLIAHRSFEGSYWGARGDRVSLTARFAQAKASRNPWLRVVALVEARPFRFWPWTYWQTVWQNY